MHYKRYNKHRGLFAVAEGAHESERHRGQY